MSRDKRLDELRKLPPFAAVDHRFFLNEKGEDTRLSKLPRKVRQKLKVEGRKIGEKCRQIMRAISKSGVGYPVDQILRDLAIEYTHRYAASGVANQPASFNYFEAFCTIKLIDRSDAPYAEPAEEIDHLFSVADYFDYLTADETPRLDLADLRELPEARIHHFTQNGSINDFTYMTAEGREFVISGFSMVRRGDSLHWYVLGGEMLSEAEWQERSENDAAFDAEQIAPSKFPFLSECMKRTSGRIGAPVALQGTKTAVRTIIAGETDLTTSKHVARCYTMETENSFTSFCDDPDVVSDIADKTEREKIIAAMIRRVESTAVMWNLAESFFQLPRYFQFRLAIPKDVVIANGKPTPRIAKGGQGMGTKFKHDTSIEVRDVDQSVLRSYTPRHYAVETEGYWRRLPRESYGYDMKGNQIQGRTWIKASHEWRAQLDRPRTVYIKSSVAAAKLELSEYLEASRTADASRKSSNEQVGVLYVLRCLAMSDEIYKVGWTSGSAEERARELSSATGVPVSFVVVEAWPHRNPEALEKGVHAMLDPYRLNERREFFKLEYRALKTIIEAEIARSDRHQS